MQCESILELGKVASLSFLEAPYATPEAFDKDVGKGRSWLLRDGPRNQAVDALKHSLRHVAGHIASHGPFDGAFGFSQGAAVVALLCEEAVHRSLGLDAPPFGFLVLVCSALYWKAVLPEYLEGTAIVEPLEARLVPLTDPDTAF